ncbi:MAG: hypothetical protein ACRDHU_08000 [Actinomycetota bacterium]
MPDLYAISTNRGGFSSIEGISLTGSASPLFGLGDRFAGGLTYDHATGAFYAIAHDGAGFATLYRIALSGAVQALFGIGSGFTGGLAVRPSDGSLFAIGTDPSGFSSIYRITLAGSVQRLFGIAYRATGGLAHDPRTGLFYALAEDSTGFFSIYRLSMSGAVSRLFGIGYGFRGGLAYHPGRRLFYAISVDPARFSTLSTISLSGAVRRRFGVGVGFEGAALSTSPETPGAGIWFHAPLANERFVAGERVYLEASATLGTAAAGFTYPDGSSLQWTSDLDGPIGTGPVLFLQNLSLGTHTLQVAGYGMQGTRQVRIFSDLGTLFASRPADAELARLEDNFTIHWVDGATPAEQWTTYENDPFDITSTRPSKLAALARVELLRHCAFSRPLPFAAGRTLHDHIRLFTRHFWFRLDAGISSAGGGHQSLAKGFSQWSQISGDPAWTPHPYVYSLQLVVHENRHNEPGDPSHTSCPSWTGGPGVPGGMDAAFEGGSGYASGVLYELWVNAYGLFDPPAMKTRARDEAAMLLDRFCAKPTHSDPAVQAILDQLIP